MKFNVRDFFQNLISARHFSILKQRKTLNKEKWWVGKGWKIQNKRESYCKFQLADKNKVLRSLYKYELVNNVRIIFSLIIIYLIL